MMVSLNVGKAIYAVIRWTRESGQGWKSVHPSEYFAGHLKDTSLFNESDSVLHILSHAQFQHHPRQPPPGGTSDTPELRSGKVF